MTAYDFLKWALAESRRLDPPPRPAAKSTSTPRRDERDRAVKYLQFPLIASDVALNVLLCVIGAVLTLDASMVRGSWLHTLSARAGHMAEKKQPYFAWVAGAIDLLFGDGHCAAQWERESRLGSVWTALNQQA